MKKNTSKDTVILLDRYTKKEVARYPSVGEAAKDLDLRTNTIYAAIYTRKPVYDCYWVYSRRIQDWHPATACHMRVNGIRCPEKLKRLLNNI